MNNILHFICPTDHIESVIDSNSSSKNYFFTSLGNSIHFTEKVMTEIKGIIKDLAIAEIIFSLSDNNRIILDAMADQDFAELHCLDSFYKSVLEHKSQSQKLWKEVDIEYLLLSNHLLDKVEELKNGLKIFQLPFIPVSAKVFHKHDNTFSHICHELLSLKYHNVN